MPGLTLSLNINQSLQTRLSLDQRIGLRLYLFQVRSELVQELRGERYNPKAECPDCFHKLSLAEILQGFNDNPQDYTTGCPQCGQRFVASLVSFGQASSIHLNFYCPCQTLDLLRGKEQESPEGISRWNASVFQSAVIHYGSLRKAFEQIDADYSFDEIGPWKDKVQPFLGRLPDTTIAECIDVPVSAVRYLRRKLGIDRFSVSKALEEVGY